MIKAGSFMSTSVVYKVDRGLREALPGRCDFCLAPASSEVPWCEACWQGLPWNRVSCSRCAEPMPLSTPEVMTCGACLREPPSFTHARVALRYEDEIAQLIQRFKFSASPRAGAVLVALLVQQLRTLEPLPEALVAVPLAPRRARERGFDQVAWLARRVAYQLGLPLLKARRVRDTPSQVGLRRRERRGNLSNAFAVEAELPAHIALLDDIITTGATCEALASACRQHGAETIEVWAVARTPRG